MGSWDRGPSPIDTKRINSLLKRIGGLEGERLNERAIAYRDASDAVRDKGSESQRKLVASLAAILVFEDRL